MHQLDIDIPHSLRPASFRIVDCSAYDGSIKVEEGLLEVFPPSSAEPVVFHYEPGSSLTLNANLLHLNPMKSVPLPCLPDGSYFIKQSVKPHNKVYREYLYFRNTLQLNSYYNACTCLISQKDLCTSKDYNVRVRTLMWIKQMIDAAKYMAEENHLLKEANQMYTEVNRKLEKLSYAG
jgi:hypothetical protein